MFNLKRILLFLSIRCIIIEGKGAILWTLEKIREIRTAKSLSMYRFTQITGISGHHIKGIEEVTLDTLKKLLVLLGISMSELFGEETDSAYLTEKE